jgi:hypothetical protein
MLVHVRCPDGPTIGANRLTQRGDSFAEETSGDFAPVEPRNGRAKRLGPRRLGEDVIDLIGELMRIVRRDQPYPG